MLMVGHFCGLQDFGLVSRSYWWPPLCNYVEDYICSCDGCCWSKYSQHRSYGLLQHVLVHDVQWKSIFVDFIDIPASKGFDANVGLINGFNQFLGFNISGSDV